MQPRQTGCLALGREPGGDATHATTSSLDRDQGCDDVPSMDADSVRHLQELDDVEAPFAALVLGNVRLRPAQSVGQLHLGQASGLPRPDEQVAKARVSG